MPLDPLSVQPIVLPESRISEAVSQNIDLKLREDERRRQRDAQKMQMMAQLTDVEAIGWERDQTQLDQYVQDYQDNVTSIMMETDGTPSPMQMRQIKNQATTLKALAKKSLADKESYKESKDFILKNFDKLNYEQAQQDLVQYYRDVPLQMRGDFDMTPYLQEERIYLPELMDEFDIGKFTKTVRGKEFETTKESIDREGLENKISSFLQTDNRWGNVYADYKKSGVVDSQVAFVKLVADMKQNELDVKNVVKRLKKSTGSDASFVQSKNEVFKDNLTNTEYNMAGYRLPSSVSSFDFQHTPDNTIKFDPVFIGTAEDGAKYVVGTTRTESTPKYINKEQYIQEIGAGKGSDYVPVDENTYMLKGSNKSQLQTVVIPYNRVESSILANIKDYEKKTGITKDSVVQEEADWISNLTTGK